MGLFIEATTYGESEADDHKLSGRNNPLSIVLPVKNKGYLKQNIREFQAVTEQSKRGVCPVIP
jgi:hypothetical protein